ncbi:endonuclease MutS2 [Halobacillus sp. Nhm2S1]|uniref:endonuclease MutS2 n=1 Tax=Halobacillus sp. Nhm2S1 TaxID=2866716 RepID=UPI001C730025|nr:endonuclease MutS2 [Halobacillus sp. Nhm2S1]MBX0359191.1 endonuclease MutS2 [Halobacillus sp. Nhm2S1]
MNQQTFDSLGLNNILTRVSDFAHTDQGKETILHLQPSNDQKRLERMHEEVKEARAIIDSQSHVPIHTLDDIQVMIDQGNKGLYIRPQQFGSLVSFLEHCTKLKRFMKDKQILAPTISLYVDSIADLSQLEEEIYGKIRHGQIDESASKELGKLRRKMDKTLSDMKTRMESSAKKYSSFLQENRPVDKGGRLTLPVKRENRSKVKGVILDQSSSGATLFIEPKEVTSLQEEFGVLKMQEEQEVERILYALTASVLEKEHELNIAMETMHQYDVLFAKAKYSKLIDAYSPIFSQGEIEIREGRHPLLGGKAVPLNLHMGEDDQALLITGPNTGGKTVTLKTVGLFCLMAQCGLPISSQPGTRLPLFQHVFVDIGDGQSIEENLSTFSSRLTNLIHILQQANDHSLLLLDEIGSGTDPGEGMGLATAILDQLANKGSTILATTHYSEMKTYAMEKEGFVNGAMAFDLETLKPTYQLQIGTAGKSQAFDIAYKLGLHPEILNHAYDITYKQKGGFMKDDQLLKNPSYAKQVAINRYRQKRKVQKKEKAGFQMGDNVWIPAEEEMGIVYKGPNAFGNYVVQVKGEKKEYNHKRLKLHISADELYPEDYDFDIVFKSKEYRKVKKVMDRKHVDGLTLEDEE